MKEDEWGAFMPPGVSYDPNTARARRRRAEGRCGYCGHEDQHGREGCQRPDCHCDVTELSPQACARITEIFAEHA